MIKQDLSDLMLGWCLFDDGTDKDEPKIVTIDGESFTIKNPEILKNNNWSERFDRLIEEIKDISGQLEFYNELDDFKGSSDV